MDLATLIGLLLAFASIFGAFLLEGGSAGMLLVLTAFLIVFGGTIGATLISFPLDDFKRIPYFFKMIFSHKPVDYNGVLEILVTCADKARREGVLSLENYFDDIDNPFMLHGLQMVVDGTAPELTRKMLESEIDSYEYSENIGAEIFMTAGGFGPTMGIIGTVMGMINVLSNLSQPDQLAAAIAVAFLATLYGIASANLLWIPFGTKIKIKIQREILLMEMILEGITSIQDGENPRILRDKLTVFLSLEAGQKAA